tara:strand:- start:127 stop:462 length:336 start_codon:yes stop_codon:yes gene_type:complete
MNDFDKKFDEFLEGCQKIVDEGMRNYPFGKKLTTRKGSKYIKIISEDVGTDNNSRTVWGFVEKSNGDILKPASWSKPAKHNRGNIFDEDPLLFIGLYGPAYMDKIKKYYGV